MQARYYDPVIGRFYSNDPVDAVRHLSNAEGIKGFNRYSYATNNPYKYTDPDGKQVLPIFLPPPPPPVTPILPAGVPPSVIGNYNPPPNQASLPKFEIKTVTGVVLEVAITVYNAVNSGESGEVQEDYGSLEAAVGSVNPLDNVELEGKTKSPGLREQGFTEKWSGTDSDGTIQTAFKNPETGRYTGGHESSKNDKYW